MSNEETMVTFGSISYAFIEDDGSYGGQGVRPLSCGDQPHDYVLREAMAEWLTDVLVKIRQRGSDSSESSKLKDVWGEAFGQFIRSHDVHIMRPFLILNATHHEDDDAAVSGALLRDQMTNCHFNDYEFSNIVKGKWSVSSESSAESDDDIDDRVGDGLESGAKWPATPAESNATLRLAYLMICGREHILRVPVWEGQSVDRWNVKRLPRYFRERYCGEWTFPKWFVKDCDKMSASQSALKRHKQGKSPEMPHDNLWFDRRFVSFLVLSQDWDHQLIMFAVEVGNYTAGLLWWKD